MQLPDKLLEQNLKPIKHPGSICIANYKGGVGKTTLTCLLGYQLAYSGKKVLLIDIDPQCSLSLAVGYDISKLNTTDFTIYNLVTPKNWESINKIKFNEYVEKAPDIGFAGKLSIIKGSFEVDELDMLLIKSIVNNESATERLFAYCRNFLNSFDNFDYILVDCPPNKMFLTQAMLRACKYFMTVTIPDGISIYGMPRLLKWVKKIPADEKPHLLGVALNAVNRIGGNPYGTISQQMAEKNLLRSIGSDLSLEEKSIIGNDPVICHIPKLDVIARFLGQGLVKDAWFEFKNSSSSQDDIRTKLFLLQQRIEKRIDAYAKI